MKLTCLSSYPEFRMIGGSSKLKNRVCLNVYRMGNVEVSSLSQSRTVKVG